MAGVSALGAMVLTALPASADPATPEPDLTVVPDAAFQACLNGYLGQPADASVTAVQLGGVTGYVDCSGKDLGSIAGAEYLTGATGLDLSSNPIADISPLNGLVNLATLFIDNTQVTDLSPLTSLTGLRVLMLGTLPTNDVSVPANLPVYWGTDMDDLVATTQVGSWVTLPTYDFDCVDGDPCPADTARTWSVQSGGAMIDGSKAMVTSSGTTVLTWSDGYEPGGSGTLTITASVSCNGFTDVSVSDWFYDPVCWLTDNGLTKGSNPAGTVFSPNTAVTRGQMAAFLQRLAATKLPCATYTDAIGC